MLEIMGKGYVIEHCISLFKQEQKKENYRIYVAKALEVIAENTAMQVGGKSMTISYTDIYKKQETKTADEIIDNVLENAGLLGGD